MASHSPLSRSRPRPSDRKDVFSWIWRQVCAVFLRLSGWKLDGDWPDARKAVLVAAPHTSNWDALWMLAAAGYYRVKLRWMGKKSLTDHPLGGFVRWLGCVPVDRASAKDMVDQMASAFEISDRLILAVAPEGTRSVQSEWKSGFHRIARRSGVPLIIAVLDYGHRTVRIAPLFQTSDDYVSDLARIREHYTGAEGLHRTRFKLHGDDTPPRQ